MTAEILSYFHYDPVTGHLRWAKPKPKSKVRAGHVVSYIGADGYLTVTFHKKRYKAHRICWLLASGDWPDGDIDHINGDRTDNRLDNLRVCSRQNNLRNMKKQPNKSSVYKGVSKRKDNQYEAYYSLNNKKVSLGLFTQEREAALVYNINVAPIFKDYARFNVVFEDVGEELLGQA